MKIKNMIMPFIFVLMLLLTSCQTDSLSPIQRQLVRYAIKPSDLPSGWSFQGKDWGTEFGGESYAITYRLNMYVFITHNISIHSSEDRTKQAFKEWEDAWFNLVPFQPINSFSPLGQTDDYRYECEQSDNPLKVCIYLQRHNPSHRTL